MKKILNATGLKNFLKKKFPNLVLELRSRQFIESYVILHLKSLLGKCCLLVKHRKGKRMRVRDLKITLGKKLEKVGNPLYVFKNLAQKKESFSKAKTYTF